MEDVRVVRVCVQDMQDALREIRPSAMREVAIEVPEVCLLVLVSLFEIMKSCQEGIEPTPYLSCDLLSHHPNH